MKALFTKKIIIRLMVVELIVTLAAFALTPYLFGTIKPFNPKISNTTDSQLIKNPVKITLAINRAEKRQIVKSTSPTSVSLDKKKKKKKRNKKKVNKQNTVSISGLLSRVQLSIYMEGSHKITKDDKTISIAYSNNLDLTSYEGMNVKVTGTIKETTEGNGSSVGNSTETAKTYIINVTSIQVL